MKTTAIRLEEELHAQLAIVAQLEDQTVTDAIRAAIVVYIEQRKAALSRHAEAALADIEREAATRRQAITALFGESAAAPTSPVTVDEPTSRPKRGKDGGTSSS
jgi:predicted DNA-binding protein